MSMLLRRAMMSGGAIGGGGSYDPYFEQVVALLHAEGANGGVVFTDSSNQAGAYTYTSATTSTAQVKFGATSASLLQAYSVVASSANLNISTGQDFTDEGWFYFSSLTTSQVLIQHGPFAGAGYELYADAAGRLQIYGNGAAMCSSASALVTAGSWYHVAVTRLAGVWGIWCAGVNVATSAAATFAITGALQSGESASYGLKGYFDELRSTVGVARYTTTFTPPAAAFPNSSNQAYATWNPSDKGTGVTLSNGNLSAVANGLGVRATLGKSTGSWYFEYNSTGSYDAVGVATSAAGLSATPGTDNFAVVSRMNGEMWQNGSNIGGFAWTLSDTIGVAFNAGTGAIYWYKNGVFQVTKTLAGTLYPIAGTYYAGGYLGTANFGATPFKYTIPTGYNPGIF